MSATAEQTASAVQPPGVGAAAPDGKVTTIRDLKPEAAPEIKLPMLNVGFRSLQAFELTWRIAGMFAASNIVPERFQNNRANCAIAVEMAMRMGASPLLVMQNLYVVYGNPAWSAKFLIACFNQCGRFSSIKYAFQGTRGQDDWGARAHAIEYSTRERLEGVLIDIALAKAEGWYGRKDSKWKTMPEQMLRYRSAAWFINSTAPEISMGLPTTDQVVDAFDGSRGANGQWSVDLEALRDANHEGRTQGDTGAGQQSGSTKSSSDPPPDPATWVNTLMGITTNRVELDKVWAHCQQAFGGEPPDTCLVAYEKRHEALGEREGKQLDNGL